MSRKIPGVLSREELMAAQLKAKERGMQMRLKIEKEMETQHVTHVPVKVQLHQFCQDQPLEREVVTKKIEYKRYYVDHGYIFEKVEITTINSFRHNGDGCYYFYKTLKKKYKVLKKIFENTRYPIFTPSECERYKCFSRSISEEEKNVIRENPKGFSWVL